MGADRPWHEREPAGGFEASAPGAGPSSAALDEIDLLRAGEYGLLATLLRSAPDADTLARISALEGDATPLGRAHTALAEAARASDPALVEREFFNLFVGLGRGELLPYASYYLTGFLHDRPLARVRQDLAAMGLEAVESLREPEDHIAILCEIMAGLAGRHAESAARMERQFFERHLKPWAAHFLTDLEQARSADFYRPVGTLGRLFLAIEAEGMAIAAGPENGGGSAQREDPECSATTTRSQPRGEILSARSAGFQP